MSIKSFPFQSDLRPSTFNRLVETFRATVERFPDERTGDNCIRQLASENERYVYNASELARLVGCSRPTLNAKADFIDDVLPKIGAEKRRQSEHPLLEQFRERIEDLEADKKTLEKELSALRKNHAKIYSTLLNESVDASILIKPIVEDESHKLGKCILCNQKLSEAHKYSSKRTIVHIDDHRKDGG